jgi:hypothetical protein
MNEVMNINMNQQNLTWVLPENGVPYPKISWSAFPHEMAMKIESIWLSAQS